MSDRTLTIAKFAEKHGVEKAMVEFDIKASSVRRRQREARAMLKQPEPVTEATQEQEDTRVVNLQEKYANELIKKYSLQELKSIIKGSQITSNTITPIHDFKSGDWVTIGVLSDTHLGSIYTNPQLVLDAFEMFKEANVDMVVHAGDLTEGLSNRPGHIYELSHIGYTAQKNHAIEIMGQWKDSPLYMISGNHDDWYVKGNGAYIVDDICQAIPNAEYLGSNEGSIYLKSENGNKTEVRLWHGLDGSSYAISYRLQKLIESFSGGAKPNVLIAGHVHKHGNFMIRNVHCISAGCIQGQSAWMRGKRLSAHTGFFVIKIKVNDTGVGRIITEWFPFYV